MRFFSFFTAFLTVFLVGTGVWATPFRHDPKTISVDGQNVVVSHRVAAFTKALEKLDEKMESLTKALGKLNSHEDNSLKTLAHLAKINMVSSSLKAAMKKAFKKLTKCKPFNKAESEAVLKFLVKAAPNSQAMNELLIAKKPEFDTAIMHSISVSLLIADAMKKTQVMAIRFQHALMAKLSPEHAAVGPVMEEHINNTYKHLIGVFQEPGEGQLYLPKFKDVVRKMLVGWFRPFSLPFLGRMKDTSGRG